MDYVFFAFSAICVSMVLVMSSLIRKPGHRRIRLGVILASIILGIGYYYFDVYVSNLSLLAYYFANMMPQVVLLILLAIALSRSRKQ